MTFSFLRGKSQSFYESSEQHIYAQERENQGPFNHAVQTLKNSVFMVPCFIASLG